MAVFLGSAAVAVTFAEKAHLPFGAVLTPLFVAASVFGAMNGQVLGSSRVYVQGAVDGQLPRALAMISVTRLTPTPALALIAALALFLTAFFDVFVLISYFGLVSCLMIFATLVGLLYRRRTRPETRSPVATPILLPVAMAAYVAALIVLTVRRQFWDSLAGLAIVASGLPVYYLFHAPKEEEGEEEEGKGEEQVTGKEQMKGKEEGRRRKGGNARIDGGKRAAALTIALQKLLCVVEQEEDGERKNN